MKNTPFHWVCKHDRRLPEYDVKLYPLLYVIHQLFSQSVKSTRLVEQNGMQESHSLKHSNNYHNLCWQGKANCRIEGEKVFCRMVTMKAIPNDPDLSKLCSLKNPETSIEESMHQQRSWPWMNGTATIKDNPNLLIIIGTDVQLRCSMGCLPHMPWEHSRLSWVLEHTKFEKIMHKHLQTFCITFYWSGILTSYLHVLHLYIFPVSLQICMKWLNVYI